MGFLKSTSRKAGILTKLESRISKECSSISLFLDSIPKIVSIADLFREPVSKSDSKSALAVEWQSAHLVIHGMT